MRQTRKSSLFLMELILAILFFALAAAVCVRLFGLSYSLTRQSEYRNTATLQSQSIAEIYRNDQGDLSSILQMTNATASTNGGYCCYLDQEGGFTSEQAEQHYKISLTPQNDSLQTVTIEITPPYSDEALVTLTTAIYKQQEVGADGEN